MGAGNIGGATTSATGRTKPVTVSSSTTTGRSGVRRGPAGSGPSSFPSCSDDHSRGPSVGPFPSLLAPRPVPPSGRRTGPSGASGRLSRTFRGPDGSMRGWERDRRGRGWEEDSGTGLYGRLVSHRLHPPALPRRLDPSPSPKNRGRQGTSKTLGSFSKRRTLCLIGLDGWSPQGSGSRVRGLKEEGASPHSWVQDGPPVDA